MAGTTRKATSTTTYNSPPSELANTTPPTSDHSFTLQTVLDLHRQVERLATLIEVHSEKLAGIATSIEKLDTKIFARMDAAETRIATRFEAVETKVSSLSHKVYAATCIASVLMLIGGFFINKSFDVALALAKPALTEHATPSAAPAAPSTSKP